MRGLNGECDILPVLSYQTEGITMLKALRIHKSCIKKKTKNPRGISCSGYKPEEKGFVHLHLNSPYGKTQNHSSQ